MNKDVFMSESIKDKFLSFFAKNGHHIQQSFSIVAHDDDSLMFTNAGMAPMKKYFLDISLAPYNKICSAQKCLRVYGKQDDINQVGYTNRHMTFFTMLGNFSFNAYDKAESIKLAYQFLKEINIDWQKIYVTVYYNDDEAASIWLNYLSQNKIVRIHTDDNFWSMGNTGPCGPCSEIYYDIDNIMSNDVVATAYHISLLLEIWNVVFIDYNKQSDGSLVKLSHPCIDTGMGLERLVAVLSRKRDIYQADILGYLIQYVHKTANEFYFHANGMSATQDVLSIVEAKIIVDHTRAVCICIADGVYPGNNGREFVVSKIFRRAVSYSYINNQFVVDFAKIAQHIVETMGHLYPELLIHKQNIINIVSQEQKKAMAALSRGLQILQDLIKTQQLSAELVFKLHDTYGFPMELTTEIATLNNIKIDMNVVDKLLNEQKQKSSIKKINVDREMISISSHFSTLLTEFVGYDIYSTKAQILFLDQNRDTANIIYLITDQTVFYAEAGGQCGDSGIGIINNRYVVHILNTVYDGKTIVHICDEIVYELIWTDSQVWYDPLIDDMEFNQHKIGHNGDDEIGGDIAMLWQLYQSHAHDVCAKNIKVSNLSFAALIQNIQSQINHDKANNTQFSKKQNKDHEFGHHNNWLNIELCVDIDKRKNVTAAHTATHLLQSGLRKLDKYITQQGSAINQDHLRFDFSRQDALSTSQITWLEQYVNSIIAKALKVTRKKMSLTEAKQEGALSFFGDRYGEEVYIVSIYDQNNNVISKEFCGGTHVSNTEQILVFKIENEYGISSRVRRINAFVGQEGIKKLLHEANERQIIQKLLLEQKASSQDLISVVKNIVLDLKNKTQQLATLQKQQLVSQILQQMECIDYNVILEDADNVSVLNVNVDKKADRKIERKQNIFYVLYMANNSSLKQLIGLVNQLVKMPINRDIVRDNLDKTSATNNIYNNKIIILFGVENNVTSVVIYVSEKLSLYLNAESIAQSMHELLPTLKFGGTSTLVSGGISMIIQSDELEKIKQTIKQYVIACLLRKQLS